MYAVPLRFIAQAPVTRDTSGNTVNSSPKLTAALRSIRLRRRTVPTLSERPQQSYSDCYAFVIYILLYAISGVLSILSAKESKNSSCYSKKRSNSKHNQGISNIIRRTRYDKFSSVNKNSHYRIGKCDPDCCKSGRQ